MFKKLMVKSKQCNNYAKERSDNSFKYKMFNL